MRAVVVEKFSGLESLLYTPEPEPKVGRVVIEIAAFGIHHAEMHMRRGIQPASANGEWYLTSFGSFVFGNPSFPPRTFDNRAAAMPLPLAVARQTRAATYVRRLP